MSEANDDHDDLLQRALKRVKLKLGFYIHLGLYLLANSGIALLQHTQGDGSPLQSGPLLGWSLGLAIHGAVSFLSLQGDGGHERRVDAELKRLRKRR